MDELLGLVKEQFRRLTWTHKAHWKTVERLQCRAKALRLLNIVFLVSAVVLPILPGQGAHMTVLSVVAAGLALLISVYQWAFNPDRQVEDHRRCANALWYVRECYLLLIADMVTHRTTLDEARVRAEQLVARLKEIYDGSPEVDSKAMTKTRAGKGLPPGLTQAQEAELLLPETLRKDAGSNRGSGGSKTQSSAGTSC